jgi:hypothetical protein
VMLLSVGIGSDVAVGVGGSGCANFLVLVGSPVFNFVESFA